MLIARAGLSADVLHAALAPGETLLPGARERLDAMPRDVAAVILPLAPEGEARVPAAARRLLSTFDARYHHPQTWYAPSARVASREPLAGWTAADAAPALARAIDAGQRVAAMPACVTTPVARSLDAWISWSREEGAAWGALAARAPRFAPLAQASRWSWLRHNVLHAHRRAGEVAQATRRLDVEATWLHLAREAAWGGACARAYRAAARAL